MGGLESRRAPHPGLHRHIALGTALQPQPHMLPVSGRWLAQGRWAGPPMQQGVSDGLVVVDAQAAEGPEQGRDVGLIAHLHRNQRLACLDALVGEAAHLGFHPAALQRLG